MRVIFPLAFMIALAGGCDSPASIQQVEEAPARVSDLHVQAVSEDAVVLAWTAVEDGTDGPARYAVRRGSPTIEWGSAAGTEQDVGPVEPGSPVTLPVGGLEDGTPYQFQLVSYRGTLNVDAVFGAASNIVSVTTPSVEDPPLPPAPPTPPALSAGTASATAGVLQVSLSAQPASGGVPPYSYQWYGGVEDPGTNPAPSTALAGLTSLTGTRTGLTGGVTYYFRLVATDNAGTRAVSNVTSATAGVTPPPPPPPLVVGQPTAVAGNGQVVLDAPAPTGGVAPYSYQWHGGTSDPGSSPAAGTALAGLTSRSATRSGLTNGTTYYFRLVVVDAAGTRTVSSVASATPTGGVETAQTLMHEDWSAGISTSRWSDGYSSRNHSVVQDPTGSGRGAVLRATHVDNGGAGFLAHWVYGSGQTNPTGEIFIRTSIFVPANFDGADYAKMLIIKGNRTDNLYSSFGQAGVKPSGTNFFESYVSYGATGHSDTGVHFYTYHVDMPGTYGHISSTRSAPLASRRPAPGAWHKVEFWLRQNTVGQSDGAQRIWVDGQLILEWTGLRFRTSNILQANAVALTFSSSNNQGQVWYVDDVDVFDRMPSGMSGW